MKFVKCPACDGKGWIGISPTGRTVGVRVSVCPLCERQGCVSSELAAAYALLACKFTNACVIVAKLRQEVPDLFRKQRARVFEAALGIMPWLNKAS